MTYGYILLSKSTESTISAKRYLTKSMPTYSKQVKLAGQPMIISGPSKHDRYFNQLHDEFENAFYEFVRKHLDSDSTVLDVGANIGITTLILSRTLGHGKVFAFEPAPTMFSLLEKNLCQNDIENATAINSAVGSKCGQQEFLEASAYGHIVTPDSLTKNQSHKYVPVTTLDKFIEKTKLDRVDFIKIDVEGFEHEVIIGMERLESRFHPLVYFEFNTWCIIAFSNENPRSFLEDINNRYSHVYYFENGVDMVRLSDANVLKFLHRNLIHNGCVDNLVATNNPERWGLR